MRTARSVAAPGVRQSGHGFRLLLRLGGRAGKRRLGRHSVQSQIVTQLWRVAHATRHTDAVYDESPAPGQACRLPTPWTALLARKVAKDTAPASTTAPTHRAVAVTPAHSRSGRELNRASLIAPLLSVRVRFG